MELSLRNLVAGAAEIAAAPATAGRLLALLEDPDAPLGDAVAVIESDPGLTAGLLRLCNSAHYGLRRQVGSVREALVYLGARHVLVLAFATSMGPVLRRPLTAYRLGRDALWRHSLATALAAARLVAPAAEASQRSRAFTAGLLHDVGKVVIGGHLERAERVLPAVADPAGLRAAERAAVGHDHAAVGGALAESWSFPTELAAAIAGHHPDAAADPDDLTRAVAVANVLAGRLGWSAGAPAAEPVALAGMDEAAVADAVRRDLEGWLALLGADA